MRWWIVIGEDEGTCVQESTDSSLSANILDDPSLFLLLALINLNWNYFYNNNINL